MDHHAWWSAATPGRVGGVHGGVAGHGPDGVGAGGGGDGRGGDDGDEGDDSGGDVTNSGHDGHSLVTQVALLGPCPNADRFDVTDARKIAHCPYIAGLPRRLS